MAHTTKDKEKLLHRVRRIKGQISAIEKALNDDQECAKVDLWPKCLKVTSVSTLSILAENQRPNRQKPLRN
jgi:hypothetical protein